MKKKVTLLLVMSLCTIVSITGCSVDRETHAAAASSTTKSIEEHISRIKFENSRSDSSQLIQIVHAYEGLADYAEAAKAQSTPDLIALHREHVVQPYKDQCSEEGAHWWSMDGDFEDTPIKQLDYLIDGIEEVRTHF